MLRDIQMPLIDMTVADIMKDKDARVAAEGSLAVMVGLELAQGASQRRVVPYVEAQYCMTDHWTGFCK